MEAPQPTALDAAAHAPRDRSSALRLSPLPPLRDPSFELTHPYIELVYTSTLGPSAVMVARSLGRVIAVRREPITICPVALALELGMRSSNDEDPLGRRSRLRKAIDRLEHERLVRWVDDRHLAVYAAVPAVSDRVRDRLPPSARRAHEHFVGTAVIDLRDGRA